MSNTTLEFPENGLIDREDFSLYTTRRPTIIIAVERQLVGDMIVRNSNPDKAETQKIGGVKRAQANAEKFTTPERLTGLEFLRQLDEDGDLIADTYRHNETPELEDSVNLDSLSYGATGTDEESFGFDSRVKTGTAYSVGEYDLTDTEQRNAVYETGTMKDGDGEQSSSLYKLSPVQLGNAFVQFISIKAGTPGMLAYVLHNIQNTHAYGARTSRTGKVIENHIRAIIEIDHPAVLSTGELLEKEDPDVDEIPEAIASYIEEASDVDWDVYTDEETDMYPDYPERIETLLDVTDRQVEGYKEVLRDEILADTTVARDTILNN